jgi:Tetracyclin repressor-like, C-terminal domain
MRPGSSRCKPGERSLEAPPPAGADRPLWSSEVLHRAHERGEIDLDKTPHAILTMPFDLMRHDLLMTLKPLPEERVLEIVDELFMPLVEAAKRSA